MPAGKIHLTLAFLGEVGAERLAAAREAAPPGASRLRVRLDCVGSFRRARVAWAGALAPDAALVALVALQSRLAQGLRDRGFELEDRPFAPHLTLARRTVRPLPKAAIAPVEWTAGELALMRSDLRSGEYETVAAWPMGGEARR